MLTLIFDLDDTLIPESAAIERVFKTIAAFAADRYGLDPAVLRQAVLDRGLEQWHAAPSYAYCHRLAISPWEALSSDFPGPDDDSDLAYLRAWVPEYRQQTWQRALRDAGVDSPDGAAELAERFRTLRHESHAPFPETIDILTNYTKAGRTLGLITNGASDLQRQKLACAGLTGFFPPHATLVSSEVRFGKPEPEIFSCMLERLSIEPRDAVMIGDNAVRDIGGALAAGMHAIWVREGRDDGLAPAAASRIDTIGELPVVLEALEARIG